MKRLKGDNSNSKVDINLLEALEPFEVVMIEGKCWTKLVEVYAYGCLTRIFVKISHAHNLRENNIKVIGQGFIWRDRCSQPSTTNQPFKRTLNNSGLKN